MLVRYVCTGDGMFSGGLQGGLNKDSWEHFYVYDPVCKFPYVNKGWYRHWSGVVPPGGENVTNPERYYGDDCSSAIYDESGIKGYAACFDDVVIDDCSITAAEASGNGYLFGTMYDTKCALYTFLSFLPFLISLYYLKLAHEARPKGKKSKFYWFPFYPHKANMNEKMIFLNMQFSVFLCIVASDIECLAYRLDFESSRSFFMALLQFSPTHVGILLVTAWITIIDGGKNKTTPRWCRNLEIAVVFYGYVVTTFLSIIGYHICLTDNDIPLDQGACEYNHYPSEDGIISGVKKLVYITIFATYGTLSGVYGAKISYQLRSGKGKKASPEEKKIKRWCYTLCVLFVFGVWGNTQAMGPRWGRTIKIPAFCEMDWTTPFIQINLIQWGIVYAMQPMKKGKKLTTHIVSSAFAKFRSTDASGRKRSKSSKSRSSTKTAGDSSTNGSSTRSSSNNSSANSSKTSSLLSSVKSASSSSSTSGSSSMGSEGSNSSSVAFESEMTSSFASESDSSFASEMGGSAFESVADGSAFEPEEEPVAVAPYGNKVAPE
ncbi:hypothetical protein ScalyP_jg6614 [Parmales sp. scaly parma]|nr:hypothetical protein ScalyP_jg6614 [Parmales sp. scaly parma]